MYDKLFEWLIQVVNDALEAAQSAITQAQEGGSGERLYIGVLDIYGFEIFEKNGFEQVGVQWKQGVVVRTFADVCLCSCASTT
jgi:myosin-1